jgi:hypothetical protein
MARSDTLLLAFQTDLEATSHLQQMDKILSVSKVEEKVFLLSLL